MPSIAPRRKLGVPLVWLGGGCLLGALLGPPWPIAPVLALGLGSTLVVAGLGVGLRPRAWVGPAVAILAFLAMSARTAPTGALAGPMRIEGLVTRLDPSRGACVSVERARAIEGDAPLDLERLWIEAEVEVGDRVTVRADVRPVVPFRNDSPHPSFEPTRRHARGREVVLEARAPGRTPDAWLARARARVRDALRATLADDVEGLVIALVLGDPEISEEDGEAARAAGLSHVIAVSGMHVTLVVGACVWLLARLAARSRGIARRIDPRVLAWTAGAALAPLYAAFAGGSPSAWRAAATASVTWILAARGRRADLLAVTALVVIGGALMTPDALRSPAFVLSVVATAAVLEPRERALDEAAETDAHAHWRTLLRAAVRASVATAPFTLWCFGALPPLGIVANLVVVPVVAAVLLPLGTIHACLASVSPVAALLTAGPTELVARAFLALSRAFADVGSTLAPPLLDGPQLVVVGLGALALVRARRVAEGALAIAITISLVLVCEAHLRDRERPLGALRVTFLDVGQGDAALVDLPDGQLWAIDVGGAAFGSPRDPGLEAVAEVLAARRRERVDVLVITHPHPDHRGGFAGLASRVVVGEVWDSGQASDEAPDGSWARTLRGLLVPVRGPEQLCGRPIEHGGARIEVLWPCPRFDPGYDANDNSLVLRIRHGRRSVLMLGDAEAHTERALARTLGHVDVVKAGHHGSRTSSTAELVRATRPWLTVISAGPHNRYGHPHAEVVSRWADAGVEIARTDVDGSVSVWTDGDRLEATTYSGRALEAPVGRASLASLTGRR